MNNNSVSDTHGNFHLPLSTLTGQQAEAVQRSSLNIGGLIQNVRLTEMMPTSGYTPLPPFPTFPPSLHRMRQERPLSISVMPFLNPDRLPPHSMTPLSVQPGSHIPQSARFAPRPAPEETTALPRYDLNLNATHHWSHAFTDRQSSSSDAFHLPRTDAPADRPRPATSAASVMNAPRFHRPWVDNTGHASPALTTPQAGVSADHAATIPKEVMTDRLPTGTVKSEKKFRIRHATYVTELTEKWVHDELRKVREAATLRGPEDEELRVDQAKLVQGVAGMMLNPHRPFNVNATLLANYTGISREKIYNKQAILKRQMKKNIPPAVDVHPYPVLTGNARERRDKVAEMLVQLKLRGIRASDAAKHYGICLKSLHQAIEERISLLPATDEKKRALEEMEKELQKRQLAGDNNPIKILVAWYLRQPEPVPVNTFDLARHLNCSHATITIMISHVRACSRLTDASRDWLQKYEVRRLCAKLAAAEFRSPDRPDDVSSALFAVTVGVSLRALNRHLSETMQPRKKRAKKSETLTVRTPTVRAEPAKAAGSLRNG